MADSTRSCRVCEAGPHTCGLPRITEEDTEVVQDAINDVWTDVGDGRAEARRVLTVLTERGWRRG